MAISKYTITLMQGFGTTPAFGVLHHKTAATFNRAIDMRSGIDADRSRSRSEKATLYRELQTSTAKALEKSLKDMLGQMNARSDKLDAEKASIKSGLKMAEAIQIVAALRGAGFDTAAITDMAKDSKDVAVALNVVPSALSGLSPESAESVMLKHFPELVQAESELAADFSAYKSLERNVSLLNTELVVSIDSSALETRFDESQLKGSEGPTLEELQQQEELRKKREAAAQSEAE